MAAYPDCVLTHDDSKVFREWSLSKHGFSCARWDDPLVQDYASPALEELLKGIKVPKKFMDLKKTGFKDTKLYVKNRKCISKAIAHSECSSPA